MVYFYLLPGSTYANGDWFASVAPENNSFFNWIKKETKKYY